MDRVPLKAQERTILGKKVKTLRKVGLIPAHVFGNNTEVEHVSVNGKDFLAAFKKAGETGLIDLRIGEEKIRPVLIKEIEHDPVRGELLHIGFYQVNLKEKVTVPVPIVLIEPEEEIESVKMGEAVVLQNLAEVQVEALPTDLIEHIEVNIAILKNIDDAITVADLTYNRETITILAEPEEVVVKLAPAVTEEMKQLMEEQEAETEAAAAEQTAEEGGEAKEGEAGDDEEAGESKGGEESAQDDNAKPEEGAE
jgi:large subunit ribosomal protein L25